VVLGAMLAVIIRARRRLRPRAQRNYLSIPWSFIAAAVLGGIASPSSGSGRSTGTRGHPAARRRQGGAVGAMRVGERRKAHRVDVNVNVT